MKLSILEKDGSYIRFQCTSVGEEENWGYGTKMIPITVVKEQIINTEFWTNYDIKNHFDDPLKKEATFYYPKNYICLSWDEKDINKAKKEITIKEIIE